MPLLLSYVEVLSVFLVVFYLYCRSPAFPPLRSDWARPRGKIGLFFVFGFLGVLGNALATPVVHGEALVNARAVGATLAGLLGGPWLGLLVGATAGLHRLWLGGEAGPAGAVATIAQGLLAGGVHLLLQRSPERLIRRRVAFATAFTGEVLHLALLVVTMRPLGQALEVVRTAGPSLLVMNPLGAMLFTTVLLERQREQDTVAAASSSRALEVAKRALGLMARGLERSVAVEIAHIVQQETGVGAVAVTDRERVLAWVGMAGDHHGAGTGISNPLTRRTLETGKLIFADGVEQRYACQRSPTCPLHSALIVPLQVEGEVVGTVQLFEPSTRRFLKMHRSLGEGIGALLSGQLLQARFQEQRSLLVTAELKLLQAQVNPHFLFNALNTIIAVTRRDPARARDLLVHLSNFFRKNLKRSGNLSTLQEELEHVSSYLEIEKARFPDRLVVETDVDPAMLQLKLPTFTLQPLIENAIKHGLSTTPDRGTARIRAYRKDDRAVIEIEDDAGTWSEATGGVSSGGGLGMKIVDRRIKDLLGAGYGVSVHCVPDQLTRVTVELPAEGVRG